MRQNQTKIFSSIASLAFLMLLLSTIPSCKPKEQDNPEEVITTLKLTFSEGSNVKIFQFKDADGLGSGLDGVADTITLDSSKTYQLAVEVLDESTSPASVVSDEIRNEAIDHQFFFNPSVGLLLTQAYDDQDSKGNPIGLSNLITTTSASTGTLRVNLKHQPGVKDGNQTTGASDIDVSFQTIIR